MSPCNSTQSYTDNVDCDESDVESEEPVDEPVITTPNNQSIMDHNCDFPEQLTAATILKELNFDDPFTTMQKDTNDCINNISNQALQGRVQFL